MPVWKRWSWPYRAGVLFALMLLLSGFLGGCPLEGPAGSYAVPGVRGAVSPERQTSSNGRLYYGVREIINGKEVHRFVYEGSPEYEIIDRYFRGLANPPPSGDRAGVPGGSGTPPLPAVQ